jgi:hypothetical protein
VCRDLASLSQSKSDVSDFDRFILSEGGEGGERGAIASARRVRGPVTLDAPFPSHPPSLGFASA